MRIALVLLAIAGASPALAQERPQKEGWGLVVGAGGVAAPSYEGDDAYRLSILPNIQVLHGDTFFASVQEGIGYRIINDDALRAGPIARIRFSRDADGDQPFAITGEDSSDLLGLDDVDTSFELGGFVEYSIGDLTIGGEIRQAVTGHDGLVADLGASWSGRAQLFGPPILWSISPRVSFVDNSFNDAYFGVTSAEALASGLPLYTPDGGLYSYGLGATAVMPVNDQWTAVLFAGYDRLASDAGASPLVQQRGSEHQATIGLFLSYTLF